MKNNRGFGRVLLRSLQKVTLSSGASLRTQFAQQAAMMKKMQTGRGRVEVCFVPFRRIDVISLQPRNF